MGHIDCAVEAPRPTKIQSPLELSVDDGPTVLPVATLNRSKQIGLILQCNIFGLDFMD
jgi:hypothetical protein